MFSTRVSLRLRQLLCLGCVVLGLAGPVHAGKCHFSVGWEPWKPYQFRNADGELEGLDVEVVRAVVERLDCSLEYHQPPWYRRLFEAGGHPINIKEDDIHVMFSRSAHPREIVDRFNRALTQLRKSGEYDAIMDRYSMD